MVASHTFEPVEVPILAVLCRHLDVYEELMAAVRRDGVLQEGHIHPALVEARQQAAVIASLAELLRR
jgi:hypothetical protein